MVGMKSEHWALLQQLGQSSRTISGNQDRSIMRPLLEAGYVVEQAANMSDTVYTITESGRAALRSRS